MRHLRMIAAASTCLGIVPGVACAPPYTQACAPLRSSHCIFDPIEASGHPDVLRPAFHHLNGNPFAQAVLVAFCSGELLEGFAGEGRPVATCAVVLIALGLDPLRAATCSGADASPVAFGLLGLPIAMLSRVSGLPVPALSVAVSRQKPALALFMPSILLAIVNGRRGLRQAWSLVLMAGVIHAGTQAFGAATLPVELVDVVAVLSSIAASLLFFGPGSPLVASQSHGRSRCPRVRLTRRSRSRVPARRVAPSCFCLLRPRSRSIRCTMRPASAATRMRRPAACWSRRRMRSLAACRCTWSAPALCTCPENRFGPRLIWTSVTRKPWLPCHLKTFGNALKTFGW